ncbi:MAG: CFI-box-CTERM domain-containing protein [Anaerolineales bacterium]
MPVFASTKWTCVKCGEMSEIKACTNCGHEEFSAKRGDGGYGPLNPPTYIECKKCGERWYSFGCSKCGASTKVEKAGLGGADCFIATATYGSPYAQEVDTLRKYRDTYLLKHGLGRMIVRFYERFSPPLAAWIAESPRRRHLVRKFMMPILLTIARRKINQSAEHTLSEK